MKYKIFLVIVLLAIVGVMFAINYQQETNTATKEEIIADIPEMVYTQDCMPQTLVDRGVSTKCFYNANTGNDMYCSKKQLQTIKNYYNKEEWKKDPKNGTGKFCAE